MHKWLAVSKPQCFSVPRCISWCIQSLTCDTPLLSLLWISMCVPAWIGCCTIGIWLIDGHSSTWLISCLQKNTYTQVNIKKLKPSAKNWKNWNKYCTYFCLEILLSRPPLAAVGSEEFPLTSPLQLLLLWPILPHDLHLLAIPNPLLWPLLRSLGSLALFFLGLPGGLLFIWGCIGGSPVRVHIF